MTGNSRLKQSQCLEFLEAKSINNERSSWRVNTLWVTGFGRSLFFSDSQNLLTESTHPLISWLQEICMDADDQRKSMQSLGNNYTQDNVKVKDVRVILLQVGTTKK